MVKMLSHVKIRALISPNLQPLTSNLYSVLDHRFPLRTASLRVQNVERLVVRVVDDHGWKHHFLRDRELPQPPDRRHRADAALHVAVVVARGEQPAGPDGAHRLLRAVD